MTNNESTSPEIERWFVEGLYCGDLAKCPYKDLTLAERWWRRGCNSAMRITGNHIGDANKMVRMLTEDEVLSALHTCGTYSQGRVALVREHGPYEIDRTTTAADRIAIAIQRKCAEVNGLSLAAAPSPAPEGKT